MELTDRITTVESNGRADARNPRSSATGLGQFIDSTWLSVIARHRPDLAGLPRAEQLALRKDPTISRQMTSAYASDNADALRSAGLPVTDGTTYLAHFAGPGGARSVLSADPSTPVANVLPASSISANPFLAGKTAGWLTDWAARKMGGAAMTMPAQAGGSSRSGRFGFSGVEPSAAPAPVMTMPEPSSADDDGASTASILAMLAPLLQGGGLPNQGGANAAPMQAPAPLAGMEAPEPVQFDSSRFWNLLGRRGAMG